jgi:competence ComEA-like helix-hairpin-helix protein
VFCDSQAAACVSVGRRFFRVWHIRDYMVSYNYIRHSEASQNRIRAFAFVISVSVCALLCIGFAVSSFEAVRQSSIIELDERINPNEAPVSSLVRLPGVGISRAEAIAAYRNNFSAEERSKAFQNCDDLQKIKGIGPKTAQNISQWLTFE